jgi:hypothetical protein
MKMSALGLCALLVGVLSPASAQVTTSPGDAAVRVYNWCLKLPQGSMSECSCVAGFYAGATAEDEFRIIGAMMEFMTPEGGVTDEQAMVAALLAEAKAQAIDDDRLDEIMANFATFDMLGEKADSICVPVESHVEASPAG